MQFIKIVVACVVAAIVYGIVHDQFTARLCIEYFTVFHPTIVQTQSPTLLAFVWGIVATWWVGAILGLALAIVSRAGSRPRLNVRDLLSPIATLLAVMACFALVAGFAGYLWGELPARMAALLPSSNHKAFVADWWAHNASYLVGFVGGLTLCVISYMKRVRMSLSAGPSATT